MPPFPDTLQVNHYFATLAVFLSPLSQFLEDVGSLPFPEPEKLLPSQGLSTSSCLHLYITSPLHLTGISPQIDPGEVCPDFPLLCRKTCCFLPLPHFLHAVYRVEVCVHYCCRCCWLPHWNVSSMKACLSALFTRPWPSTKRGPGT